MVVISPTWPPDSVPSAMTASAPAFTRRLARMEAATTGKTFTPASFQAGMYLPGLPAPVVTTWTPSSMMIFAISSAQGFMSIRFTPKGLPVKLLQMRICSRSKSAFSMPPVAMTPRAPALEQAAANSPVAILAMPP